ncbi:MAG: phenylacetic acid degradation protein PaaN [Bacteroidetes bacterium]|nr:phenylacetic acid degradation protein PaaN [Bacteroidota bacterium]
MSNQAIQLLNEAMEANHKRSYYAAYPEQPKAYGDEATSLGLTAFQQRLNQNYTELNTEEPASWIGEEVSPYMQTGLGIHYPAFATETYITKAQQAWDGWAALPVRNRAEVLVDSLERFKARFFEIAFATMHTTGQGFMMSFQASGPHAADRALEAIAVGVEELERYPAEVNWVKPMGKFDLSIRKNFKPMPKGINLVIGCSTFPTWNTVPGLYAALITGNPVIVKPHPKSILPIAMVVAELRNALKAAGLNPDLVQLAPDTVAAPVTKLLAEHPAVQMIDYTGGPAFGLYVEGLNKTCFTEKAGVNPVIVDSVQDIKAVQQNLAFSICLYSGQMCTAPQYIFVPAAGVRSSEGTVSYEDFVAGLSGAVKDLVENPKAGPFTLGAIQNELTIERTKAAVQKYPHVALESTAVQHPEFPDARMYAPVVLTAEAAEIEGNISELFGPCVLVVKTGSTEESLALAAKAVAEHGAITCLAYTQDSAIMQQIEHTMNRTFTPVSFNFTGAAFVNSHAAFSDFHVSGGNAAGNASFTNSDFINRRFVWVGNRFA